MGSISPTVVRAGLMTSGASGGGRRRWLETSPWVPARGHRSLPRRGGSAMDGRCCIFVQPAGTSGAKPWRSPAGSASPSNRSPCSSTARRSADRTPSGFGEACANRGGIPALPNGCLRPRSAVRGPCWSVQTPTTLKRRQTAADPPHQRQRGTIRSVRRWGSRQRPGRPPAPARWTRSHRPG